MKCDWRITDETIHGRRILRCTRQPCKHYGIMPLDGESKSLVSSGCRGWPTIGEPGYWLVVILAAIGITQGRYVFCKQKLGLSPICKCPDRAEAMNTIWQDALAWLKTTARKLTLKGYNSTKE